MDESEAQKLMDEMMDTLEVETLVEAYVRANGDAPPSVQERAVKAILDWAYRTRLDQTTLDLALKGAVVVGWEEDRGIVTTVTEAGRMMLRVGSVPRLPPGMWN